jgi:hypothetical protein
MVNDPSIAGMHNPLIVGGVGSRRETCMFYVRGASFWQQDQAWRQRSHANQSDLDVITAVTSKMSTALTGLSSGLASIANQRALTRVQAQIQAAKTALTSGPPATSSTVTPATWSLLSLDTLSLGTAGGATDATGNLVDKTA